MQKDMEQKNSESMLKSTHTMKVLQFYNQENEKSRKIIELSNEILQESYFVLNGNMLLTETMREKFGQLYKIHDQRGVKFTESDEIFEIFENHNQADYLFDFDHLMVKVEDPSNGGNSSNRNSGAFKRSREFGGVNGDEFDVCPMKKRVVRSIFNGQNLDTKHVLASHAAELNPTDNDNNMNTTFAIKPVTTSVNSSGNNKVALHRALKESNSNIHKGFTAPKPITKPMAKVKSTLLHSGKQRSEKENKRTPSKSIRRSPRSVSADPFNRSMC